MSLASSLGSRRVAPEILDGLPPNDPRAIRSRGDLRRVNALMFQPQIAASLLRRHLPEPPRRILEIGGGDGLFSLSVARRLAQRWQGVEMVLLDRLDLVSRETMAAFRKLSWTLVPVVGDVFDWLDAEAGKQQLDGICANLFLHHFDDSNLLRLLRALRQAAPLLLATEPRRAAFAFGASRLLWAVGANDVTRHDAPASVRAGFSDGELSRLWSQAGGVPAEERSAGLFSHVFAGRAG